MKHRRWTKEELEYLNKWYGIKLAKEIAIDLNTTTKRIIHKAYELQLKSNLDRRDNTLKKIKESTKNNIYTNYLDSSLQIKLIDKGSKGKYKFECHCGKIFETTKYRVKIGQTKSCGCSAVGRRKGTKNICSTYWTSIKQGAEIRNLEFSISIDYAEVILIKQDFKCALSGRKLIVGYKNLRDLTLSLDRINPILGYIEGNVQWVHKNINICKQRLSNQEFIEMCKDVYEFKKS